MTEAAVTRARLAEEVSEASGVSLREADLIVDAVFEAIAGALRSGEEVEIRGFGSFRLRERKARHTRNPRTGEAILVPPKRVPFFRAGKALRDRLNAGPAPEQPDIPALPELPALPGDDREDGIAPRASDPSAPDGGRLGLAPS